MYESPDDHRHQSPGLDLADVPYDAWQLAAVAIGTAASKGVPITVDTVQYYNRIVGFTALDPLPSWGSSSFIQSEDPRTGHADADRRPARR